MSKSKYFNISLNVLNKKYVTHFRVFLLVCPIFNSTVNKTSYISEILNPLDYFFKFCLYFYNYYESYVFFYQQHQVNKNV